MAPLGAVGRGGRDAGGALVLRLRGPGRALVGGATHGGPVAGAGGGRVATGVDCPVGPAAHACRRDRAVVRCRHRWRGLVRLVCLSGAGAEPVIELVEITAVSTSSTAEAG